MPHPFSVNHYGVLGLDRGATDEEIEAAYQAAIRSRRFWSAWVGRSRRRVEKAYAVLRDPELRRQLDEFQDRCAPEFTWPPM